MDTKKIIKELEILKTHNPDLIIKKLKLGLFKSVYIITYETLSSTDRVNNFILKYFSNKSIFNSDSINTLKDTNDNIPSINKKIIYDKNELLKLLHSGFTIVIYKDTYLAYETRADIDRGVNEPSSETVIRGPKDAFTENYNKNIGLIRKRIKSTELYLEELTIGKETQSKVGILYMNNIVKQDILQQAKDKLNSINIDGPMDVNNLKDYLDKRNKTVFPTLLYTEKPDDTCRYLLDGRLAITMENSPSILIIPTFFIDFLQNSEDYYHKAFFASFIRIIRFFAFFLSIITPALFIAVITYEQQIIPTSLLINFTMQRQAVPFPAIVEALILMFTFELLYEGDARTPSNRGTSLSIVGALVLGDAAVQAGLISPIMVLIMSISAISSLIFIYYDMQGTMRFYRYLLMLLASLFGLVGFICGLNILIINMCSIKTFGLPYTLPISPLFLKDQSNAILKRKQNKIKTRPSYLTNINLNKEG